MPDRLEPIGWDRDRLQLPGQQQPRQQLGVAAIGLDAVAARPRRLARRDDHHLDPGALRRARQPEPGRAGLIDRANRRRASPSATPPPPRCRHQTAPAAARPTATSIAAPCVERAWTSIPTHVIVPCKAGPSFAWGQPEPNLRPDKPPHKRKGPAYLRRAPTEVKAIASSAVRISLERANVLAGGGRAPASSPKRTSTRRRCRRLRVVPSRRGLPGGGDARLISPAAATGTCTRARSCDAAAQPATRRG